MENFIKRNSTNIYNKFSDYFVTISAAIVYIVVLVATRVETKYSRKIIKNLSKN